MIDTKAVARLTSEVLELSEKRNPTKAEKRSIAEKVAILNAVKAGESLESAQRAALNDREIEAGLTPTRFGRSRLTAEQRARGEMFQNLFRGGVGGKEIAGGIEYRAETGGSTVSQLGTYTGLGSFVPTEMLANIFDAMAEHDVLFDVDGPCTVIESTNARPLRVPTWNDTLTDAVQVNESSNQSNQVNLANPNQVILGSYSFRTPVHAISTEVFQDLSESFTAEVLFERWATPRLARGIGQALISGGGNGTPTGLLSAIEASGVNPVVAAGSSTNDGSSATGAHSIGSQDLMDLLFGVNAVYRDDPSAGFLMNSSTFLSICNVVDKYGNPVVRYKENGSKTIYGYPVYICPSMPNIAASAVTVIFGALRYVVTRIVWDANYPRVRVLTQAPGLAENGCIGLQILCRADGVYAFDAATSNAPLTYLVQHS
jgi:HK97 family phage major capsid protein